MRMCLPFILTLLFVLASSSASVDQVQQPNKGWGYDVSYVIPTASDYAVNDDGRSRGYGGSPLSSLQLQTNVDIYEESMDEKVSRLVNIALEEREKETREQIQNLGKKLQIQEILLTASVTRMTRLEGEIEQTTRQFLAAHRQDSTLEAGDSRGGTNKNDVILQQAVLGRQIGRWSDKTARTCFEIFQKDSKAASGYYLIDPSGGKVGEQPVKVHCDMAKGTTSVVHDSEMTFASSTDCFTPGCFTKPVTYEASRAQLEALAQLSKTCRQTVRYDCYAAPLEHNDVRYVWWDDRHGKPQYFWSGQDSPSHTCNCGIKDNCLYSGARCNCDGGHLNVSHDAGTIESKKSLPITALHFGQAVVPNSFGHFMLGPLVCSGQEEVTGMPKSCSDLWRMGHSLSGIYSVQGFKQVVSVYCDFSKPLYDEGFETYIGFVETKSVSVHFFVQRNSGFSDVGKWIPFDLDVLNYGKVVNLTSGCFVAPRPGKYFLVFNGMGSPYSNSTQVGFRLLSTQVTPVDTGKLITRTFASGRAPLVVQATLNLNQGDKVVPVLLNGALANYNHQFSGHMLEEDVVFRVPSRQL